MNLPLTQTLGTVDCPVFSSKADWMLLPWVPIWSSSRALNRIFLALKNSFTFNKKKVFGNYSIKWQFDHFKHCLLCKVIVYYQFYFLPWCRKDRRTLKRWQRSFPWSSFEWPVPEPLLRHPCFVSGPFLMGLMWKRVSLFGTQMNVFDLQEWICDSRVLSDD